MEGFLILVTLVIVAGVIALPIVALIQAQKALTKARSVELNLFDVKQQLDRLQVEEAKAYTSPEIITAPGPQTEPTTTDVVLTPEPDPTPQPTPASSGDSLVAPSGDQSAELRVSSVQDTASKTKAVPIQETISDAEPAILAEGELEASPDTVTEAAIEPESTPDPDTISDSPLPTVKTAINWEQFMGVKLFAWVGGLALFLAVVFFVKYSFENNLIPPEVRIALGFLTGIGLIVGGVVMTRRRYVITSHTLISTGILILYGTTFAARAFYHFTFFGAIPTFLMMALVTAAAFVLSVRLNAMVVAVLGMLGGFLTPVLLSTGVDNPLGLFGYLALLVLGLLAVAFNRRWFFLALLAAAGTTAMQIGWAARFFAAERYFDGNKVLVAMAVLVGFSLIYLALCWLAERRQKSNWWFTGAALGLAAVAFAFGAYFLSFGSLGERPLLILGYILLIDIITVALIWPQKRATPALLPIGLTAFSLLAAWTAAYLRDASLHTALAFYFLFAVLHTALPAVLERVRGCSVPMWWGQYFPVLTLLLILFPVSELAQPSFFIWPFVLLINALAILLALFGASLLPVLLVMPVTLLVAGISLTRVPTTLDGFPLVLGVIGLFSIFFVSAGVFLSRGLRASDGRQPAVTNGAFLSAFSAILPFLLLIIAVIKLPIPDPSPVFGVAALLVVLLLGITRHFRLNWMPAVGLACTVILEATWHFSSFSVTCAMTALTWYLGFFAAFAAFPFVFSRACADRVAPWATAALSGPLHFYLIYHLVKTAYPNEIMGLIPVAFAIPALSSLVLALGKIPADSPKRMATLAWFGGVGLFFITAIFPIQFDKQWITLGWALEGVALLWLLRRIPHEGLKIVGVVLLAAVFTRLAVNPAVLEYHARSMTPVFNWYLYTYGIATVCLFAGARLLRPPRNRIHRLNVPPLLYIFGTVLAFLLVNIEIADYFTPQGSQALTFQFSRNIGQDMTYTITWSLFAFVMLIVGIARKVPAARYAALGLLGVAVIKLFLHDLSKLQALYRIGAFLAVALIAIGASFVYQRFLPTHPPGKTEPSAKVPKE